MYRPKVKNEDKLNAFIEKLEKQRVFKEEVNDNKTTNISGKTSRFSI